MSYSIVTINVNGLRDKGKRLKLFHYFEKKKYDIIFAQETHCGSDDEVVLWSNQWSGKSIWNNGSSQSKGVAVLFKKQLDIQFTDIIKDDEGRLISFSSKSDNDQVYQFTNIYAPNNGKHRRKFLKNLQPILQKFDTNVHVIGGDFNCVSKFDLDRNLIERSAHTTRDEGEIELADLQNVLNLEDVWRRRHPNTKMYTFSRGNSKSRIDYFLCS